MTRLSDQHFTMPEAPVFGFEDPFYDRQPRDSGGRFSRLVCVNAHDRCYGGAGGPCPYCEVKETAK